jgi:hypothetical protein
MKIICVQMRHMDCGDYIPVTFVDLDSLRSEYPNSAAVIDRALCSYMNMTEIETNYESENFRNEIGFKELKLPLLVEVSIHVWI